MEWDDIADLINKEFRTDEIEYKSSAYRKPYQGAKKYFEAGVFNSLSEDKYITELEKKKTELQRERYKIQATKLEVNRNERQDSKFELFYENVRNAITTLPLPEFIRNEIAENDEEHVLVISDIHYGACFDSENNTYSREECKRRFNVLFDYAINYVEKNNISHMKVLNIADDIQGLLRLSDLQINDVDVVQCVVEVAQIIAQFLNDLSAFCDITYYHTCYSNHTQNRPLGSKASLLAGEDMEKIIANYINDILKDNMAVEVVFDTTKEYLDFDIFDFHCTMEHGHRVKNPNTFLRDKSTLRHKCYDYAFLGHSHSSKEIIVGETANSNVEVLVAPSFIGSDPYSDTLNVGSKAMAKIYVFDEVFGHIGSSNIILN